MNDTEDLDAFALLGQWLTKHGGYETVYAGRWRIPGRDVGKSFRVIFGFDRGEHAAAAAEELQE